MGKFKDLSGQRFGRLTVLERGADYVSPKGKVYVRWKCHCDCGAHHLALGYSLAKGTTQSCGCLRNEQIVKSGTDNPKFKHGGNSSRLSGVWKNMIQRCHNPQNKNYADYGGRGIAVCDEWRYSFEAFRMWAINSGYDPCATIGECTIDRIDNSKGYGPDNCRWVGMDIQAKNRRKRR